MHNLDILKEALTEIGFSSQETENQIKELGEAITLKIMESVSKSHPEIGVDEIESFIKSNNNNKEILQIIETCSQEILQGYLVEITQDLPKEKQDLIFTKLRDIK